MLFLGILIQILYIVNHVRISSSQINQRRTSLNEEKSSFPHKTLSRAIRNYLPVNIDSWRINQKNEDLLARSYENRNFDSTLQNGSQNGDLLESFYSLPNRIDNSLEELSQPINNQSNSFDDSVKDKDELEKIEMHTNNHQSINTNNNNNNNGLHHSRHYNTYQIGSSNSLLNPNFHYANSNKYSSNNLHNAPHNNAFAHNLNLNYIHSLLSNKPTISSGSGSNSLSNILNSNSLTTSYGGYTSPYYNVPQVPSNGIQQSVHNHKSQHHTIQQQPNDLQLQNNQTLSSNDFSLSFSTTPQCGKQQIAYREPRIVGGNNTFEGEFPWAVSIQRHGNHHCGGVIVGKRWILTAAHCVRSQLVGNLIVRTGGHTLSRSGNSLNSHLERDYFVDQIVMHGDFSRYDNLTASQMKSSANTNNADIALLRLKQDIIWNEFAWPVCFPHREAGNFSGHDATVIGWGKLNEKSEDFSNELQKVKLTIIDNKVCQNWFRQAGRDMPIDDRIICAGFKSGGKDACHGDSGGPLLSKINGHYVVVGVVSTGIGCARPLLPGLYSRVSSYIGWIERYINLQ